MGSLKLGSIGCDHFSSMQRIVGTKIEPINWVDKANRAVAKGAQLIKLFVCDSCESSDQIICFTPV